MELEMKNEAVELKNELAISEHLTSGWRNFSLQQIDNLAKIEKKMKKYEKALQDIANYMDNWEDFYGGVGINYHEMINSIIRLAKFTLKEGNK